MKVTPSDSPFKRRIKPLTNSLSLGRISGEESLPIEWDVWRGSGRVWKEGL